MRGLAATMTLQQLHAIVHGRVQGVNFRFFTVQTARELGLTGWVMNRLDGTVEVRAEGERAHLDKLVAFLHVGPPAARVTTVDIEWLSAGGKFQEFTIK